MDTLKNETTAAPLHELITDYIENNLAPFERDACQQYFNKNKHVANFVDKSRRGLNILNNAISVKAADDFEEKLAKRIAILKEENLV